MPLRLLLASLLAVFTLAAPALAQDSDLSDDYRVLLTDAASFENGAHFEDTARLVARSAPGGAEAVVAALEGYDPALAVRARAALGLDTPPPAVVAEIEAEAEEAAETGPSPAAVARDERRGFFGGVTHALFSAPEEDAIWSGKVRAGLRWDEGNTTQQDYTFGLEIERALAGWGFEAGLNYAYSKANGRVSRDNFQANVLGEREVGERWTVFATGDVERDTLSSYEYVAFAGAGAGYRLIERGGMIWTLRAAPGVRYREEETGGAETGIAAEFGSEFDWDVNERIDFSSKSTFTYADAKRAEQIFTLSSNIGAGWGTDITYRYRHDFDPKPGFEKGDSRLDVALVKEF